MDESVEFRTEREEKFGGPIRFMTYATYMGEAGAGSSPHRGGIFYVINDTLHFEDFERQSTLLSLMGQKEKYSKTEMSMELADLSIVREIREKDARDCIFCLIDESQILPMKNGLFSLFSKPALQLLFTGRPSLFFDFLDRKGIMNVANEYMIRPEI